MELAKRLPLDNSRKNFTLTMIGPDGEGWNNCQLQALPTECFQTCLQFLDIASLTRMRSVSQFTRSMIDSMPQYRDLYEHAPQALRACLVTGVAAYIPLLRLHESLITMECYYCKKRDPLTPSFGTYLSLFECHRTCLFCLRNNPDLLPVELATLIGLCCQRKCPIKSIDNYRLLGTIPGIYGPSSTPVNKRSSLVRGPSVTTTDGAQLNDREQRLLFGKKESADIHHHPLVPPSDESDIRPSVHYVSPESPKRTILLYQTAVSFPYLTSGKQICDYGILCGDCNLHMRWEENRWTNEQLVRRSNHMDPSASDRVREFINGVRRKGCLTYSVSSEARLDGQELIERLKKEREKLGLYDEEDENRNKKDKRAEAKWTPGLSIQEHRLIHAREVLPKEEREYRVKMKSRPVAPPQPTHAT